MARGWESKAVVEDSQMAADRRSDRGPEFSDDARAQQRRRVGLELDRRRVLQEMETTRFEARQGALRQALAFLDSEVAKLTP